MTSPRLRILIDARMLIGRFSGVSRVVTRLVETLALDDRFRVIALCGNQLHAPWVNRTDIEQLPTTFSRADRSPFRRWRWEATHLSRFVRAARADLYHATWNSGIPPFCSTPSVLTIHDLIPWTEPQPLIQRCSYRRAIQASARRATRITTVSEFVRGEVLLNLRVQPDKVVTVPNGVDPPHPAPPAGGAPEVPYVLYVGGHEPRKNVAGVLSAMRRYWERHGLGMALRLTGTMERLDRAAAMTLNQMPAEAPITFLADPDDAELSRQYHSATALLLLSRAEGFGLPALEAMAHGCPVIAAAYASLPEIVADAGILVDPDNPDAIANALHRLTTDAPHREELIYRGSQRSRKLSWTSAAEHYAERYLQTHAESPVKNSRIASIRPEPIRQPTAQANGIYTTSA